MLPFLELLVPYVMFDATSICSTRLITRCRRKLAPESVVVKRLPRSLLWKRRAGHQF